MSERDGKIKNLLEEAKKLGKGRLLQPESDIAQRVSGDENRQRVNISRPEKRSRRRPTISQSINGTQNTQQIIITEKTPRVRYLPPVDSIGADSFFKQRIQELFNKIGEAREKRFGKDAYPAMYRKFKTDFSIKKQHWTVIWEWPKECAPAILQYLEAKYATTIDGRIARATTKPGYVPTRPRLYAQEKDLLTHLGLSLDSVEVRARLREYFGTTSHRELTHLQHWQWVVYLRRVVDDIEKERTH